MKVIYVTSDVTYVRDNYLHLVTEVTNPGRLPPGVEVLGMVLLRIPTWYVLRNVAGLQVMGAPRVGVVLLKNLITSRFGDQRVRILRQRGIPIFRCGSMNSVEALAWLKSRLPDLIVNQRTRNIFKDEVLGVPKLGCINIHHGLLPDNRGTMCDLWAWSEGLPVGFTIHWMNKKIDDGRLIVRCEVNVKGCRSYPDIPMASSRIEADALISVLQTIEKRGPSIGEPNRSSGFPHRRNPTYAQIQSIRRRGFLL
ncbi:hypothetical protein AUK22_04500 [bacterium CG2_30_54_10]|nr:MAG: hypothetical protein AUK22_04500 [bacterium CG2_30_54_10]